MKAIRILACASLFAGLSTVAAAAQEDPVTPKTTTVEVKATKLKRVGADLVGKSVVTPKDELLGKVEDVIIHPKGDIAFVEVTGAGQLKTATRRFAVPWNAITCNANDQLVLATTPDAFVKFPHYEKANLTDMDWWVDNDRKYAKLVGAKATPAEASTSLAPAKLLYLGSELRSRSIENPEGEKIATMHELVVDPRAGRVAYAVLSVGGNAGAGEKMIAVPWESLKSMPDKSNPKIERLTLNTTKEKLEKAPEFQATTEGWSTAGNPDYVMRVYEYYAVPPYRMETRSEPQ